MSAEEIFEYYKQFDQRFGLPHKNKWKTFTQPKVPKNKLKIGYVSPDFKEHSMMRFLIPTLARHNHDKFEIFAFAELEKEDKVSQEYKTYVDHWIRTDIMTDDELAQKQSGIFSLRQNYDWNLIFRAISPLILISIGAGLTIPFVNLFSVSLRKNPQ